MGRLRPIVDSVCNMFTNDRSVCGKLESIFPSLRVSAAEFDSYFLVDENTIQHWERSGLASNKLYHFLVDVLMHNIGTQKVIKHPKSYIKSSVANLILGRYCMQQLNHMTLSDVAVIKYGKLGGAPGRSGTDSSQIEHTAVSPPTPSVHANPPAERLPEGLSPVEGLPDGLSESPSEGLSPVEGLSEAAEVNSDARSSSVPIVAEPFFVPAMQQPWLVHPPAMYHTVAPMVPVAAPMVPVAAPMTIVSMGTDTQCAAMEYVQAMVDVMDRDGIERARATAAGFIDFFMQGPPSIVRKSEVTIAAYNHGVNVASRLMSKHEAHSPIVQVEFHRHMATRNAIEEHLVAML
jgi:hypothetical protein